MIGLGIPELEAKRYEGKVKAGNILLSVHTENSEEITRANLVAGAFFFQAARSPGNCCGSWE